MKELIMVKCFVITYQSCVCEMNVSSGIDLALKAMNKYKWTIKLYQNNVTDTLKETWFC